MKPDRFLALIVVIALGTLPLMGFVSQAAITGTQILDSQADIASYDFSGDYVAYVNSVASGYSTDVMLYNWKTAIATSIFNSTQVAGSAISGNYVLFQDRATPATSDLVVYNINTGTFTTLDIFSAFVEMHMDIGDGHVIYYDADNIAGTTFVRVKTISGTLVWSLNVTSEYVHNFNINNGYAMFCGDDGVHLYNIATDSASLIPLGSDVFINQYVDTDGTTIIYSEEGSYPNEFTRMVAYNIASGTKNTFTTQGSSHQFRIDNAKIYYLDSIIDSTNLYWMNVDGTGVEQISDTQIGNHYLVVEDGKAVVRDPNDYSILQMYDTAGMGSGTPATGNVIGTTGGTITRSGAVLVIPAGSLDEDVTFSMDELTVANDNVLSAFEILPNDITFDPAAELTLDIPSTTRATGSELMRLENGQWVAQASTPSADGNSLIAMISQTGTYAVTVARDTVSQVVGTAGGTLTLPDVSLNIPLNALASSVTVAIEEVFVDTANVVQAVAVNLGGTILSIPAQLNFDIPTTMDEATAQVGQLVGNAWIEVESTLNTAGQLVADITEGGIYALIAGVGDTTGGLIPFPSGTAILAIMLSTGLVMAVVRRQRFKK
ncbi:MAG: hypothetical protein KKH41_08435 [Candidatus Thermoplasmatota archaeon]|nr:hypothetical protein [Euryarchaeota archaeon]MBU4032319.1 hypothetical protein [Candidatus Thermoplasmatota archaeon]MBU4070932.1 hypothetical protein [Candidatus Thermoplasmatota archaeon]MBU4144318.1 hypothetical protein [Candidatus Thermoplasmatota archaeon]MBU4592592.1 hypothetical protein [Candidatus Thermoplasmatota archaeon]